MSDLMQTLAELAPLIPERFGIPTQLGSPDPGWFVSLLSTAGAEPYVVFLPRDGEAEPRAMFIALPILQATLQQACEQEGWRWQVSQDGFDMAQPGRLFWHAVVRAERGWSPYGSTTDSAAHALAAAFLAAKKAQP